MPVGVSGEIGQGAVALTCLPHGLHCSQVYPSAGLVPPYNAGIAVEFQSVIKPPFELIAYVKISPFSPLTVVAPKLPKTKLEGTPVMLYIHAPLNGLKAIHVLPEMRQTYPKSPIWFLVSY